MIFLFLILFRLLFLFDALLSFMDSIMLIPWVLVLLKLLKIWCCNHPANSFFELKVILFRGQIFLCLLLQIRLLWIHGFRIRLIRLVYIMKFRLYLSNFSHCCVSQNIMLWLNFFQVVYDIRVQNRPRLPKVIQHLAKLLKKF